MVVGEISAAILCTVGPDVIRNEALLFCRYVPVPAYGGSYNKKTDLSYNIKIGPSLADLLAVGFLAGAGAFTAGAFTAGARGSGRAGLA